MAKFEHQRHKAASAVESDMELVVACAPLRSNINLSRIVRAASCCGIRTVIATGNAKLDQKIARDGADEIELRVHRTLPPVLKGLRSEGYHLVGLEQTTGSVSLYDYEFAPRSCLVVGNERNGITDDILDVLDSTVEIPVYGLPFSHNAATATVMALYEFCKQRAEASRS